MTSLKTFIGEQMKAMTKDMDKALEAAAEVASASEHDGQFAAINALHDLTNLCMKLKQRMKYIEAVLP